MEPTHPAVPQDESAERLEDEENARYPEHGNPDAARERVGLDGREPDEEHRGGRHPD